MRLRPQVIDNFMVIIQLPLVRIFVSLSMALFQYYLLCLTHIYNLFLTNFFLVIYTHLFIYLFIYFFYSFYCFPMALFRHYFL